MNNFVFISAGVSGKKKTVKLLLLLFFALPVPSHAQIKIYNSGQAFTCIAVDSNYNIWAGTSMEGLYLLNKKDDPATKHFTIASSGRLSTANIQSLAADQSKQLWIGHNGSGGSTSVGGLVVRLDINNPATVKLFGPDNDAACARSRAQDGLATSNSASITVDKNGTIWSAHKYHELHVPSPSRYYVRPGSISFKSVSNEKFITKGTFTSHVNKTEPPELPYPAYKVNCISTQPNLPSRNCYAVACGNNEAWVSVDAYEAINGKSFPARLLKYDLSGNFLKEYDFASLGISGSGVFTGIWVTPKGNVWVTTSKGRILVYDGSIWQSVTLPPSFSEQISPNNNAITGDIKGNVYIGTNKGLIVYNGGPLQAIKSFRLYTANDGLLSTNIRGVAVEKDGTVWMATDDGIGRIRPYPFTVYNLIHPDREKVLDAERVILATANSDGLRDDGEPVKINVAADSSQSTLIVYTGGNAKDKKIEIVDAIVENEEYKLEFGKLIEIKRTEDSLVYIYHHPGIVHNGQDKKFIEFDFRLTDVVTSKIVIKGKLGVYHTPVLMVHGVWTSINAFRTMAEILLKEPNGYESFQLLRIWEETSNHSEYVDGAYQYRKKIPAGIEALLQRCRNNLISAGKVNIVGHSRGGLYARHYLQGTQPDVPYRNDVNSLITINTPHSGSQAANLVLDQRVITHNIKGDPIRVGQLLGPLLLKNNERLGGLDDIKGAYELRVDAFDKLNSEESLRKNTVPSHAITSKYEFGTFSRANLLKALYVHGGTAVALARVPRLGIEILRLRIFILSLGTKCVEGPVDRCVREIFNEENDLVVPLSSQRGGLPDNMVTHLPHLFAHSNRVFTPLGINTPAILDQPETGKHVLRLLRLNPHVESQSPSSSFTTKEKGFQPINLKGKYTFLPGLKRVGNSGRIAAVELTIDPLLKGKTFQFGDTVQVKVSGATDIKNLLIAYAGASISESASDVEAASSFTFPFPVPKEAIGKVMLTVYGFNDDGLVATDTSYINVQLPTGVSLDSIRIQKDEDDQIRVAANDSIQVGILGYFTDTVRRLTTLPDIAYSFRAGGIASVTFPSWLKGLLPGKTDELYVSYLNKEDTITVLVTDSISTPAVISIPLPVTLLSFTGEIKNKEVTLFWTTAQEMNNKQFELQFSATGAAFETIGFVAGRGTTNDVSHYMFKTHRFGAGNNYYRLKQIDLDGNYKYSSVVVVNVEAAKQSSISIHPNPASNMIILSVNRSLGGSLQMKLADISGKHIWSKVVAGNSSSIPVYLPKLAKGMYVMTIVTEKGDHLLTEKLIIQ